jgi:hypothetical protein
MPRILSYRLSLVYLLDAHLFQREQVEEIYREKECLMKEIDLGAQRNIYLAAYWPSQQADEPHIAYGIDSRGQMCLVVLKIWTIFSFIFRQLGDLPKVRPLIRSWMRITVMVTSIIIALTLSFISRNKSYQKSGYYQLDDKGRPILFLSPTLPSQIRGRMGISQKKFLERIHENK